MRGLGYDRVASYPSQQLSFVPLGRTLSSKTAYPLTTPVRRDMGLFTRLQRAYRLILELRPTRHYTINSFPS